jgi:multiple sugar transport system permease protein
VSRTPLLQRLLLALLAITFLLPLLWMLAVSLQGEGAGLAGGLTSFPQGLHFDNYPEAVRQMDGFGRMLFNTVLITLACIAGQLFCCSLAGYAFACLRFRGRDGLFLLVLATMMLPPQVLAIPQFILWRQLGLVDTWTPLILPSVLGGAPFFIFLFRQSFLSIGPEVREAARLDGCGPWRTYLHVMLPLVKPVLGTVAVFTFLATWNDFWTPLIYLTTPDQQTLTLGLAAFNQAYRVAVELLMAGSALVLAPCLIAYFLFQRFFLREIRTRGGKG